MTKIRIKRRVLVSCGGTNRKVSFETTSNEKLIAISCENTPDIPLYLHVTKRELLNTIVDICND